ncbi:hypothetical protein [Rhodoferax sp.]|uniref:hypothetical protein n=1 Tax=Rhodoferax sp. TaxID=50421 RepID=UPI002761F5F2|nr:hypothetical protein [Rhodoferax sp.]
MKTSVIEVHDMLSVLTVDEVEKRIGKVPGVHELQGAVPRLISEGVMRANELHHPSLPAARAPLLRGYQGCG